MVARMANKKQDDKNSKIEIKLGEFYTIVRKNTGFHKTEVLEKRLNTLTHRLEYYVHYENLDRRLDEWIDAEKLEQEIRDSNASSSNNQQEESMVTRNKKRKYDEINHVSQSISDMDPATAALEKEHEAITKVKYIDRIQLGRFEIDCWYYSPYPDQFGKTPKLYICAFCLKYMRNKKTYLSHRKLCSRTHPPGYEIYRKKNGNEDLSIFEIDGAHDKVYCQCLCLVAKLFLDHKTLYFDVNPFYFYVLTKSTPDGPEIIGYYSKEKDSVDGNNLACILTFPPYQRQGYGKLLISFSYELSKREGQVGSPEKPLSDLGRLSYRSYWTYVLLENLKEFRGQITIADLSENTCISRDDIIWTLRSLNLVKYWKGDHVICVSPKLLEDFVKSPNFKKPRMLCDQSCIKYLPHDRRGDIVRRLK